MSCTKCNFFKMTLLRLNIIYTDFSKAFNKIDHALLLQKLNWFSLSIELLEMFQSYLTNLRQFIQYRGYKPCTSLHTSGGSQDSILGLLLFIIYVNDIVKYLKVHYLLYADDVKLYCRITCPSGCRGLQSNLMTFQL